MKKGRRLLLLVLATVVILGCALMQGTPTPEPATQAAAEEVVVTAEVTRVVTATFAPTTPVATATQEPTTVATATLSPFQEGQIALITDVMLPPADKAVTERGVILDRDAAYNLLVAALTSTHTSLPTSLEWEGFSFRETRFQNSAYLCWEVWGRENDILESFLLAMPLGTDIILVNKIPENPGTFGMIRWDKEEAITGNITGVCIFPFVE